MRRVVPAAFWFAVGCAEPNHSPPPTAAPAFNDDASYVIVPTTPPPPLAAQPDDDGATKDEMAVPAASADETAPSQIDADPTSALPTAGDGATADGLAENVCATPLEPGDLAIEELMIESVAGAGDHGEWLEVRSTRDCVLDLRGLQGTCPRGAKVANFEVGTDLWLPPHGTILVADSTDPVLNHNLPGRVLAWSGSPGDVLRNKGTTVTLTANGAIIDTVTYPSLPLAVGVSLAFPDDCDGGLRSDWSNWQRATSSWFPGFFGTPNAPNVDVSCP